MTMVHYLISMIFMLLIGLLSQISIAINDDGKVTEGIDSQWLKCIVSVELKLDNNKEMPIGTGFIVMTSNSILALVTAKHVVADLSEQMKSNLAYRFNQKRSTSTLMLDRQMPKAGNKWFFSDVSDVAFRFLAPNPKYDILAVPEDRFLKKSRIRPGALVLIPGFPLGLRSPEHADPIVRRGIVARVEGDSLLLDAFTISGNSGGPVLYVPVITLGPGVILKSGFINNERVIGLVSYGWQQSSDVDVSSRTNSLHAIVKDNVGLCNIVPADAILDLLHRKDVERFSSYLLEVSQ